jgi:hypothetical protein
MMLNGCAKSGNKSAAPPIVDLEATAIAVIPALSREDKKRCYDPGIPAEVDALEIIANHRLALGDCRRRHGRVVAQYGEIKSVLKHPESTSQE